MPSSLRACALALLLCTGCDAGKPQTGTPGLEPPHDTEDAGVPAAGPTAGTGTPSGGAGTTGSPDLNAAGASAAGAGGAGGGGASGAAGVGAVTDPGGADGGPADGGAPSFSELHVAELTKDCQETVNCRLQRDEMVEADPFAACLADSAAALDDDPSRQASFLANVERCRAFVVCDYYDCATMPP